MVDPGCAEALARAMAAMSGDEAEWQRMVAESHKCAWMGDSERFADAVELILNPLAEPARTQMNAFLEAMGGEQV